MRIMCVDDEPLALKMLEMSIQKAKPDAEVKSFRKPRELLEAAQQELDALQADEVTGSEEYDRLIGWADVYDRCSFETKKMFVSKFIKAVRVFRDYRLEIDFNVSYEEFRNLTVQTAV